MTTPEPRGTERLTIVGSSPAIPRPGRACSSYALVADGTTLVVDLGTGAFANASAFLDFADGVDAIVVTHMHADHFLDLVPLRYALTYGERRPVRPLPVYLPPGGEHVLRTIGSSFAHEGGGSEFFDGVFRIASYDPSSELAVGSLRLTFAPTRHYIPTFAIRCATARAVVAFSADTAPCDAVVDLARDATLFVCEATLGDRPDTAVVRGHSTAFEAGEMAATAGAERVVLTHWPHATTPERLRAAASTSFDGRIDVADDGLVLDL